jgi:hypothetical protein
VAKRTATKPVRRLVQLMKITLTAGHTDEHSLHTGGVTGSIPVAPTTKPLKLNNILGLASFQNRTHPEFRGPKRNDLHP